MHSLEQTLYWMQTVITHPLGVAEGIASTAARRVIDIDPANAEEVVTRSETLSAVQRMEIYSHAYYARLLDCLREEFPALRYSLGEELFDEFAVGYLQDYPSASYTLFELGSRFPRYLRETRPPRAESTVGSSQSADWADFLIDLAEWELVFNQVFDGPGLESKSAFQVNQLLQLTPVQLVETRLFVSPALRLLRFKFPVSHYFSAFRRQEMPELPEPEQSLIAISRRRFKVKTLELTPAAYEILYALIQGQTIGDAIAAAAPYTDLHAASFGDELRTWFHRWAELGFFEFALIPD